jgi:hypothetical protein
MRIINTDDRVKKEDNRGGNRKQHLEFVKGAPIPPPEKTKGYDERKSEGGKKAGASTRGESSGNKYKLGVSNNGKTHRRNPHIKGTKRKKKSLKNATTYASSCRSVWIRDDLWAANKSFAQVNDRTIRSCIEEAMYEFLIQRNRIETPNMGSDPSESSWTIDE